MASADTIKLVQRALEHEPRVKLHRQPIHVGLVDDTVLLDGDVDNVAAKKLAVRLARGAAGAGTVVDRLRVVPAERKGDGAVRDMLADLMQGEGELRNCTIRVRRKGMLETVRNVPHDSSGHIALAVDDGVVTLDGTVISLSHKRLAGALAWWTPGCRNVVNSLGVEPPEADNDDEMLDALQLVLEADPMIQSDELKAKCRDYVITIGGYVRTEEERRRAEFDAWALEGVEDVINAVEVRTG